MTTQRKVYSDTDAKLLLEAIAHNHSAIKKAGAIALSEKMKPEEVRVHMAGILYHLAQTQRQLAEMEKIREANNPRRKRDADDTDMAEQDAAGPGPATGEADPKNAGQQPARKRRAPWCDRRIYFPVAFGLVS